MSSITPEQEHAFRDLLRALHARETCPICDAGRWSLRIVCGGEFLGRVCSACGHVLLFDRADVPALAAPAPRIVISGAVHLDGETIRHVIWPAIEVLIDESLASSLASIGVPSSGKSGVGGEG